LMISDRTVTSETVLYESPIDAPPKIGAGGAIVEV
jgi:hypothetical protein